MDRGTLPDSEAIRLNKWNCSVDDERIGNCRGPQIHCFFRHRPIMPHRAALVITLLRREGPRPAFMTVRRALVWQWGC